MKTTTLLPAAMLALVPWASGEVEWSPTITLRDAGAWQDANGADGEGAEASAEAGRRAWGADGSWWFGVGGGVANDFEDATDFDIHLSVWQFVVEDVEVGGELAFWRYELESGEEYGINPNLVVRWHFVNEQSYSVYADVGIGMVFTTDDVPARGTSVNFTPRVGVGMTFRPLSDSDWRVQVGVRWAHISNARLQGDDDNPARDSAMVYAGVVIPF
ncbi:MAG: acyloxyacyl hydrolase [Planctomycetota bacterium]|nr:acyloxyacyl hydrolase [Planctomycetota bacterium]